jgi:hypothetical protein
MAYAGEVVVRHSGGEWWAAGGDRWMRTAGGLLWNPVDEARPSLRRTRPLCRDTTECAPESGSAAS